MRSKHFWKRTSLSRRKSKGKRRRTKSSIEKKLIRKRGYRGDGKKDDYTSTLNKIKETLSPNQPSSSSTPDSQISFTDMISEIEKIPDAEAREERVLGVAASMKVFNRVRECGAVKPTMGNAFNVASFSGKLSGIRKKSKRPGTSRLSSSALSSVGEAFQSIPEDMVTEVK